MKRRDRGKKATADKAADRPLPDTRTWRPRDTSSTLATAFAAECKGAEERLLHALAHEKRLAVDSFDSGLPFESLVRREIMRLLPKRYSVTSGRLLDRNGMSAGNCDVVLFNDTWFSPIKSPAAEGLGHPYLPIEGVYAVGEVKQTLSSATLDDSMEKLVRCHRLDRPRTYAHRLVENRDGDACPHGLTNPLFSFIVAGAVHPTERFENLVDRFFDISKDLKRLVLS